MALEQGVDQPPAFERVLVCAMPDMTMNCLSVFGSLAKKLDRSWNEAMPSH